MAILDYLRRWWEFNARVFATVHRVADAIAGLAFIFVLLLGIIVFYESLPISEGVRKQAYYAFVVALGVFAVAVFIQTAAALRSFFAKVRIRILDSYED